MGQLICVGPLADQKVQDSNGWLRWGDSMG